MRDASGPTPAVRGCVEGVCIRGGGSELDVQGPLVREQKSGTRAQRIGLNMTQ